MKIQIQEAQKNLGREWESLKASQKQGPRADRLTSATTSSLRASEKPKTNLIQSDCVFSLPKQAPTHQIVFICTELAFFVTQVELSARGFTKLNDKIVR